MYLLLFGLSSYAAEPCPSQTSVSTLEKSLRFWFEGFEKESMWQVRKGEERVSEQLLCLTEPISTEAAFELHVLNGITFWLNQSKAESIQSFSAARHAKPTGMISELLFPKGHEIHTIFAKSPSIQFYPPLKQRKKQSFIFDGHQKSKRPRDIPTVFQVMEDGEIVSTMYAVPSEELPFEFKKSRWKKPVLYSSIGIGVLSLGLYTSAAVIKSNYQQLAEDDPSTSDKAELQRLFDTNQTLFHSALATTGLSIGLTAVAFQW